MAVASRAAAPGNSKVLVEQPSNHFNSETHGHLGFPQFKNSRIVCSNWAHSFSDVRSQHKGFSFQIGFLARFSPNQFVRSVLWLHGVPGRNKIQQGLQRKLSQGGTKFRGCGCLSVIVIVIVVIVEGDDDVDVGVGGVGVGVGVGAWGVVVSLVVSDIMRKKYLRSYAMFFPTKIKNENIKIMVKPNDVSIQPVNR